MLDPATLGVLVPIFALAIPIVAILTAHQRRMAEIIHSRQPVNNMEVDALRQEIQQLRAMVNQQAIAMDDMRSRAAGQQPGQAGIQDRLGAS